MKNEDRLRFNSIIQFFLLFMNIYLECRKVEDFTQGGKISEDLARVRYEHYNNKRKAKLIALNNAIHKEDNHYQKNSNSPGKSKESVMKKKRETLSID
jgi:hypothetical protein